MRDVVNAQLPHFRFADPEAAEDLAVVLPSFGATLRTCTPSPISSEHSTRWPLPVRWRSQSAARMPCTAHIPVPRSQIGRPTEVGGPSGSSVTYMIPPMSCAIRSKAATPGVRA